MSRRTLQELNLLDDFLFGEIMGNQKWGELFSRFLLETIFQRKFGPLRVVPQKVYGGKDTGLHGARLDVFLEEAEEEGASCRASIYDVEPDQKKMSPGEISRRTRFYHALIDADCLKSGADYESLKDVIVIFILSDDPFGADRMIYTIRSMCKEDPGMPYDDGAQTLFLYTKGTKGKTPESLCQLLHYMEESVAENAVNPELEQIHHIVESVKRNKEVEISYMKSWERDQELVRQGREEERENTERERRRADQAEREVEQERRKAEQERQTAEAKILALEAELRKYREKV